MARSGWALPNLPLLCIERAGHHLMGFLLRVRAALSWLSLVGNAASFIRRRKTSS